MDVLFRVTNLCGMFCPLWLKMALDVGMFCLAPWLSNQTTEPKSRISDALVRD